MTHGRKGGGDSERGTVLVEFSLVVVIFVALLYGLIAYGMAFALKESMTNAASEAARSAVGAPTGADAETDALATAEDRLGWLGSRCCTYTGSAKVDAPMVLKTATGNCANGPGECITVEAKYDYEASPLVPVLRLPGFTYLFPTQIRTEATVQYAE